MPVLNNAVGEARPGTALVTGRETGGGEITRRDAAELAARHVTAGELDGFYPPTQRETNGSMRAGLLTVCANPACSSGWLHLWRSRKAPILEGGWSCSAACTETRLDAAIRRELEGHGIGFEPDTAPREGLDRELESPVLAGREMGLHRHRVPLGLVMLEQGWITPSQLRQALDAQRSAGHGKLGRWLVRQGVSEQLVTRALGLQWSCPVLAPSQHDPEAMAAALPRLFVEAFGALPLRVAAGRILYLGFSGRPDPVVTLALQRMCGLHVEAGLVRDSRFQPSMQKMLGTAFPRNELIEARSRPLLARVLARAVERTKPIEAKLVRIHDCLWLRMWLRPQYKALPEISGVQDVICSLAAN